MGIADTLTVADLMHATPHWRQFNREGWIFEHKLDGFRAFVRKTGYRVDFLSRTGKSLAMSFPEIERGIAALKVWDVVLDAELVVPDERGFQSFEELRRRAVTRSPMRVATASIRSPAALCVFDCLVLKGKDLRARPLLERKAAIAPLLAGISGLQLVTHLATEGETAFAAVVALGQEGIVAKKANSPYRAGRQSTWLKIKNAAYYRQAALGIRK